MLNQSIDFGKTLRNSQPFDENRKDDGETAKTECLDYERHEKDLSSCPKQ